MSRQKIPFAHFQRTCDLQVEGVPRIALKPRNPVSSASRDDGVPRSSACRPRFAASAPSPSVFLFLARCCLLNQPGRRWWIQQSGRGWMVTLVGRYNVASCRQSVITCLFNLQNPSSTGSAPQAPRATPSFAKQRCRFFFLLFRPSSPFPLPLFVPLSFTLSWLLRSSSRGCWTHPMGASLTKWWMTSVHGAY